MDRVEAAGHIAALFNDGGETVLSEAELPLDWERALQTVPPQALQLPPGSGDPGERLLARVRDAWAQTQRWRPAIAATRALLRRRVERLGQEHPDTLVELGALGALADRAGRADEARKMLEEAWQGLRSVGGGRDMRLAVVAANLGSHLLRAGEGERAETCFEQAWRIRNQLVPGSGAMLAAQIGELRLARGEAAAAIPFLSEAWSAVHTRPRLDERGVAIGRALAQAQQRAQRVLEAEPVLRELYDVACRQGDPELRAAIAFELGHGLRQVRLLDEGFRLIEESIRWTRTAGDPHPDLPDRLTVLAEIIINERRRPGEGEGLLKEALEAERRLFGDSSPQVAARYAVLGHLCAQLGRRDEAMGYLEPAASLLRSTRGDKHPQTRIAVEYLVDLLVERAREAIEHRDRKLAKAYLEHAVHVGGAVLGHAHKSVRTAKDLSV